MPSAASVNPDGSIDWHTYTYEELIAALEVDLVLTNSNFASLLEVTEAVGLAYQSGWMNYGGAFAGLQVFKDTLGYVHLRGLCSSSGATPQVFTLPVGFRPGATEMFSQAANVGGVLQARVDVDTDGAVIIRVSGAVTFLSLAGITFQADA